MLCGIGVVPTLTHSQPGGGHSSMAFGVSEPERVKDGSKSNTTNVPPGVERAQAETLQPEPSFVPPSEAEVAKDWITRITSIGSLLHGRSWIGEFDTPPPNPLAEVPPLFEKMGAPGCVTLLGGVCMGAGELYAEHCILGMVFHLRARLLIGRTGLYWFKVGWASVLVFAYTLMVTGLIYHMAPLLIAPC